MSGLSTHVLDLATGTPATGVAISLARRTENGAWATVAEGLTDGDGRIKELLTGEALTPGRYLMTFATGNYFRGRGEQSFHPEILVQFEVGDPSQHYHVPLLLSPFGYSTYRGS